MADAGSDELGQRLRQVQARQRERAQRWDEGGYPDGAYEAGRVLVAAIKPPTRYRASWQGHVEQTVRDAVGEAQVVDDVQALVAKLRPELTRTARAPSTLPAILDMAAKLRKQTSLIDMIGGQTSVIDKLRKQTSLIETIGRQTSAVDTLWKQTGLMDLGRKQAGIVSLAGMGAGKDRVRLADSVRLYPGVVTAFQRPSVLAAMGTIRPPSALSVMGTIRPPSAPSGVVGHPLATSYLVREARPVVARAVDVPVERLEAAELELQSEPIAAAILHELREMRADQQRDRGDNSSWQRRAILVTVVIGLSQLLADHPPELLLHALETIMQALTQQLPPGPTP